jgi:hypothetical protein
VGSDRHGGCMVERRAEITSRGREFGKWSIVDHMRTLAPVYKNHAVELSMFIFFVLGRKGLKKHAVVDWIWPVSHASDTLILTRHLAPFHKSPGTKSIAPAQI